MDPNWLPGPLFEDERERMTFALLVTHYWDKDGLLVDGHEIILRIHELNGIPAYLYHGRRDISDPVVTAWHLHRRWESSRLVVIEDEGHGGSSSRAALEQAVEEIAANGLSSLAARRIRSKALVAGVKGVDRRPPGQGAMR